MRTERRVAARKLVDCITISDLTSLDNYMVIAKSAHIVDASTSGFLMQIHRSDLIPAEYKSNLSLDKLVNQQVVMYLPQMNLDLDGTVRRARHTGKGIFEVAVEFSEEVPEYWRECLIDLLPEPGEMEEAEEA